MHDAFLCAHQGSLSASRPSRWIAMPAHRYWALVLGALQRYYWDHLLPALQAKDTWGASQQEILDLYM